MEIRVKLKDFDWGVIYKAVEEKRARRRDDMFYGGGGYMRERAEREVHYLTNLLEEIDKIRLKFVHKVKKPKNKEFRMF